MQRFSPQSLYRCNYFPHIDSELFFYSILQGATDEIIANLPVIIIDSSHLRQGSEDNSCPICLNEMVIGEEARLLSCDHLFHKQVRFCVPFD